MKTADSARAALRAATQSHHEQVDAIFSVARMTDRNSYGDFLTAQAAALIPVERALESGGIAPIVGDWADRRRGALLQADLQELGRPTPPPAGELHLKSPEALLGALYVLEGSRLGGMLLKRSTPAEFPTRFLGNVDSAAWQRLLILLDQRLGTEAGRSRAIAAARDVFDLFERSGRLHVKAA